MELAKLNYLGNVWQQLLVVAEWWGGYVILKMLGLLLVLFPMGINKKGCAIEFLMSIRYFIFLGLSLQRKRYKNWSC